MPTAYPLDLTGTSSSNLVANEQVTLATNIRNRAFTVANGPFYKGITIVDNANGVKLTDSQFCYFFLIDSVSLKTSLGKEAYAVCIIKDQSVSNSLTVSYQSVGEPYIGDYSGIVDLINIAIGDQRNVNWGNLTNVVMSYNAAPHVNDASNITDMDVLLICLEKIKTTILLGDTIAQESVLNYIDTLTAYYSGIAANMALPGTPLGDHINSLHAHNYTASDFGLGNVQNYGVASDSDVLTGTATNKYVLMSNAIALINNALSGGMAAHVLARGNVHGIVPADINLGNVQNYGVGTIDDLNNPVAGVYKYVTTVVLAAWLQSYTASVATQYASDKTAFTQSIQTAIGTSSTNLAAASAALTSANAINVSIANVTKKVADAVTAIGSLSATSANQEAAAIDLINRYHAASIQAYANDAYAKGFADGKVA
ncbi:MAG: hypothetical protein ACKO0Z_20730 [Betaproteobacteria bacterium]